MTKRGLEAAIEPNGEARRRLPSFFTISEVCDATGLSESTIRREIRRKRLPSIKIGSVIRLKADDVEAWLEANRRGRR